MANDMRRPAAKAPSIHPPIDSLMDALTFRLARLDALNAHVGGLKFRETYGLSLKEWRVIGLVHAFEPATFGQIRKYLLIDKGQLSRTVRRLTDQRILLSQTAADDARRTELSLTPEGRRLHDRLLAFTAERNEIVVSTLTPEECRDFLRILAKITDYCETRPELSEAGA